MCTGWTIGAYVGKIAVGCLVPASAVQKYKKYLLYAI